jgi:ubiquinone/menaquinone biosynthesis C-methylase UbiE
MTRPGLRRLILGSLPAVLLAVAARVRSSRPHRVTASALLIGLWTAVYVRYRRTGLEQTRREYELLARTDGGAFARHYNERVATVEEEFEAWGPFHQHRHEMRYDLVADAVRRHLPAGGAVLDVGCGAAMVGERIVDLEGLYIGVEYGGPNLEYGVKKLANAGGSLSTAFVRADAEALAFGDGVFDLVVMSEVIEHLLRPERAVWEVARVLRPGGVLVMTTNNASEAPCRSPLTHLFAWLEKALGATHPGLISSRPWVWPDPVGRDVLPDGSPDVFVPHTHHIYAETRDLFAAAGLDTFSWSTFEFPPPQSAVDAWLERRDDAGRRAVDVIEAVARRTPLVRRLGCHLFMEARKGVRPVAASPPPGVWPGPFSARTGAR